MIVATDVPFEDYMERYAEWFYELSNGQVYKMPIITLKHNEMTMYLSLNFECYFAYWQVARIVQAPFTMKLADNFVREPDITVILTLSWERLTYYYVDGPADICIEVVSPYSRKIDLVDKFAEYEKFGVPEYWLVEPERKDARFYRLNAEGSYEAFREDAEGNYRTPALPGFVLNVPLLWQEKLPGPLASLEFFKRLKDQEKEADPK